MIKILPLMVFCFCFSLISQAQSTTLLPPNDTVVWEKVPLLVRSSVLFTNALVGGQLSLGKVLSIQEKHVIKGSGKEKIRVKSRVLSGNVGYYYQPDLHHNWQLTSEYSLSRTGPRGFFREFFPYLGVSRTFLTATTYRTDAVGAVSRLRSAGNWYLNGGFGIGLGKSFDKKNSALRVISGRLVMQTFYPNFRFIALKPYVQINTTFALSRFQQETKRKIEYIERHEKK